MVMIRYPYDGPSLTDIILNPNEDVLETIAARKAANEQADLNYRLTNAIKYAASQQVALQAAKQAYLDFLEKLQAPQKALQAFILKTDEEQADKGDPTALREMGARYRDGRGVEKDLVKSTEFFKKAEEASKAIEEKLSQESKLGALAAKKEKFTRNLVFADRGNIDCMTYVGKCYLNGDGVEKDITKAREYFQKATDLGSKEAATLLLSCQ